MECGIASRERTNNSDAFPLELLRTPARRLAATRGGDGRTTTPGNVSLEALGQPPRPLSTNEEYAAFAISRVFAQAAQLARFPKALSLNYTSLPQAVETLIAPHFGIALTDADRATMASATMASAIRALARRRGKSGPGMTPR
ncbi:MAG: hypothetical protein M3R59_07510 [Verrucomicrobiota bacterium]|nr:hypothetical protein [Verrucomicrobiota bacterium]